jgi:ribonucleoside-diphosphate reductase beta chain
MKEHDNVSKSGIATRVTLLESDGIQPFRPLFYPWAYDAWKKQQQMHWFSDEVSMADDINDWKNKLTDVDRDFLTSIFRFFTQADVDVYDCYIQKYARVFKPIEIAMMLTAFANMETIHAEGYNYLVESLSMKDTLHAEFLNFKAMRDKHDYLCHFDISSKQNIATTLAMYGAFTEGLQLFSSFALLLNYSRYGLMKGMSQIVTWSFRDETLHTQSIIRLFKEVVRENRDEIDMDQLKIDVYAACHNVIVFEDAFIELCFNTGGDCIRDLSKESVRKYIRYLADRRLNQLGFESIYLVEKNPIPWIDEVTSNVEFANFFEARVTEYSKASTTGSWSDAFESTSPKSVLI